MFANLLTGLDTCIPGERGGGGGGGGGGYTSGSLGGALMLNFCDGDDLSLSKSPTSGLVLGCTWRKEREQSERLPCAEDGEEPRADHAARHKRCLMISV